MSEFSFVHWTTFCDDIYTMVRVSKKRLDTAAQLCRNHFSWFLRRLYPILFYNTPYTLCADLLQRYTPSQADVHVFKILGSAPSGNEYPNVARWYKHIASYSAEHGTLPGSSTAGEAFVTSGTAVKSAAAAPAAADDDDDEVDLFGSDEEDEEAERIKAERVKAYEAKKAAKPKTIAKVRLNQLPFTSLILTLPVCCHVGSKTLG